MNEIGNHRLLWSARLTAAGLALELFSLVGLKHPWGFLVFSLGGGMMAVGILLYLVHKLGSAT